MRAGKKSEEGLERVVIARISKKKYEELRQLLTGSRLRTMSEVFRHILENRPVIIEHYDHTFDKVMAELSGIRKEIRAIGVNINQVTRKFHKQLLPQAMLANALEIAKLYQQTDLKVSELFTVIENLSKKWLPE
ncbi:MAG TPA: plasmid mobilization relaxosome protein MobC [Arachidicoccus sp.]